MENKPRALATSLHIDAEPASRLKKWNLDGSQKAYAHWFFSSRVDGFIARVIVQKFCPK